MIKFWALLLLASSWQSFTYAQSDKTVVDHEAFLKRQQEFRAKRAKRGTPPSDEKCEAKLVEFPMDTDMNESTNIPVVQKVPSNIQVPRPAHTAPKKDKTDPRLSLKFLNETKRRPINDAILRMKLAALVIFQQRMMERIGQNRHFMGADLKWFSELLALATRDIFYNSHPNENPVARVTVFFKQQQQNFPDHEKYYLTSALLRGIDLIKAVNADPDFMMIIDYWFNKHHGGRSMNSPVANFDRAIQRKINKAAEQDDRFKRYVMLEPTRKPN